MKGISLSPTAQQILAIYFAQPGKKFYVNELIRLTGRYPNSVQVALKTLEKQKILISSRRGRLKLHELNKSYKFLPEIEGILRKQGKIKGLTKEKKFNWVKLLNRNVSYAFNVALTRSNVKNLQEIYGFSIPTFWYNDLTFGVYYIADELVSLGEKISQRIAADPHFAKGDIALCRWICNRLVEVSKKIPEKNLPKMKDREIARLIEEFNAIYLMIFPFLTVPHAIERYFEKEIRRKVNKKRALNVLLSPVLAGENERDSAFGVAIHAKKHGFDQKFERLLTDHWQNFCWMPLWSLQSELLSREYFENEIRNIMDAVKNPERELKVYKKEAKQSQMRLKKVLKGIKSSRILKDQVYFLQEYIHLRTFRKNAICQVHYYHLPLLYEAARRLKLSKDAVVYLSYEEIILGLNKKKSAALLQKRAEERQGGWAILMWKGKTKTITGAKAIIENMERYRIVAPGPQAVKVVKGNPACRGRATGRVKIVRKLSELNKVEKGDVLVAKMTTPDYMIAIHKAAAIVTDEGGVTCHAAIVSREFNLPCIVGTKNATQILSDNDLVEVDANEGVVRVIEAVEIDEDVRQIYGKTAYKGKVRGPVRIVLDANDFPKVKEGDILVAPQTTPEYLSSLYKVKGFIVDEESITSHAMLYAKALKLPALIGTQFARHVLQDGERIELDASRGLVKRL